MKDNNELIFLYKMAQINKRKQSRSFEDSEVANLI